MPKFQVIKDIQDVRLPSQWVDASKFKSKNRIVNEKGQTVKANYTGRCYELVAKKSRHFSGLERFGRAVLGTLAVAVTLFTALFFSKSVRHLFTKKATHIRYGILVPSPQQHSSPIKGADPVLPLNSQPVAGVQPIPSAPPPPTLPPLPFLANLAIDPKQLEAIPTIHFLKDSNQAATVALARAFANGASAEAIFGDQILDNDFLEISLRGWMTGNHLWQGEKAIFDDPNRKAKREIIQKRIDLLDQTIQFEERFKRIQDPWSLKVKHLLAPWQSSPLRYALMMDDELSQLRLSAIQGADGAQIENHCTSRLIKLGKKQTAPFDPSTLCQTNINALALVDLVRLNANSFNQLAPHLPPFAFHFVTLSEIPKIETRLLTDAQLNVLFSDKEKVKLLSSQQLNDCITKVNPKLLSQLEETQVLSLDLSKINQPVFDGLFEKFHPKTDRVLRALPILKVQALSRYFSDWHKGQLGVLI